MLADRQEQLLLNAGYVIGRFVICEHCEEHYVSMEAGVATGVATADEYVGDHKKMARAAINQVEGQMRRVGKSTETSVACPSCHRFQLAQLLDLRQRAIKKGVGILVGSLVLGIALGFVLMRLFPGVGVTSALHVGAVALGCAVLGGAAGFAWALSQVPGLEDTRRGSNPLCKTVKQFRGLMGEVEDPLVAWALTCGFELPALTLNIGYAASPKEALPEDFLELRTGLVTKSLRLTYNERTRKLSQRDRIEAPPKKKSTKSKAATKAPKRKRSPGG